MRMNKFFGKYGMGLLSFMFVLCAAALGVDSGFAMAVEVLPNEEGAQKKEEDSIGEETQIPDSGLSATTNRENGLTREDIEKSMVMFKPFKTPLAHDIITEATQVTVSDYERTHFRAGAPVVEVQTVGSVTATIDESDKHQEVVFNASSLDKKSLRLLTEGKNVFATGVQGYDETGTEASGCLSLFVVENDGSTVTAYVDNPKANVATVIPAETKLFIGTVAAAESQMVVAPTSIVPTRSTAYLQKRISNIVVTDEWKKNPTKFAFDIDDQKQNAMFEFLVQNEITDLFGFKKKRIVSVGKHMAPEAVYQAEGIVRQIKMHYAYEKGKLTAPDLNAIAKMMFTNNAANNKARVYCGKDYLEALMNIDFTVHKEIKFEVVDEGGITINGWRNNFGSLHFVHLPILDLVGMEEYALVVDIWNANRYVKEGEVTATIDMKQGAGGDNRQATREVYMRTDCICLKGYNAILVGPSDKITGIMANFSNITTQFQSASTIESVANPTHGTILYLTADDRGYKAGSLLEFDLYAGENGEWKPFNGILTA